MYDKFPVCVLIYKYDKKETFWLYSDKIFPFLSRHRFFISGNNQISTINF